MKLTTILCNYNTRDVLARALESLLATQGDLAAEIIVVDNASRDGSADMVRQRFPAVNVIESGANRWFSGGNNLGLRAAQGECALILNPDTILPPGALATLVAYLDEHPAVGAVTPHMTFADGTLQRTCSRFPGYGDALLSYTFLGVLFPRWRERRRRAMWYEGWERDSTRAIEVAPGSCLMARRAILAQIGYFDERLKLFFTDDDLCRRIVGTGAAIHFVAEATIVHDEHASLSQVPRLTQHVYWADLLTYTRKHHGRAAAWLLAALLLPTRATMAAGRGLYARSQTTNDRQLKTED
ncbi:MAG: glycosyltransferase family 2 protein [Anaerolineae bacterium]|nr:glycosyltransferase family 2 protein [Anaerolineae bacterium]